MSSPALLRVVFVATVVATASVACAVYRSGIDHADAISYSRELRQLRALDARLNEETLKSRSGIVVHYDQLVRKTQALKTSVERLQRAPRFLDAAQAAEVRQRLGAISRLLGRKDDLVEQFKTHNAVLKNSRRFLPLASQALARAGSEESELAHRAERLLSTLLLLDIANERDVRAGLADAVSALEAWRPQARALGAATELELLLRHVRVIGERKPLVNALVRRILAVEIGKHAAELEEAYAQFYRRGLHDASLRQRALFALAMLTVALGLADVIVRLRRGRLALVRATEELQHANRALDRERQKERELGDMKARFAAMTSHEFRTPLAAVLSSTELIERYGARWDEQHKRVHFERIRASVRDMNHLLDEILLIAKGEAGLLKPSPAPVNIEELCQDLFDTLQQTHGRTHRLHYMLEGNPNVRLDERLVRHLLANLLENALKYSPAGGDVSLTLESTAAEVRMTVLDQGLGIAPEELPGLFASFRRGSNVGQIKGSGLGLAVVKHAVDAQRGGIEVNSTVGRGTEFVVWLPHAGSLEEAHGVTS